MLQNNIIMNYNLKPDFTEDLLQNVFNIPLHGCFQDFNLSS